MYEIKGNHITYNGQQIYTLYQGIALLIHSEGKIPEIIQKVQSKKDPVSGYWNHSEVINRTRSGIWTTHGATEAPGWKFKGNVNMGELQDYINRLNKGECELLFLKPDFDFGATVWEKGLIYHNGIPYDVPNLAFHQWIYYKFNIWLGRNAGKAIKRMVCHEFKMNQYNFVFKAVGLKIPFPNANKAQVFDIYYSYIFKDKMFRMSKASYYEDIQYRSKSYPGINRGQFYVRFNSNY